MDACSRPGPRDRRPAVAARRGAAAALLGVTILTIAACGNFSQEAQPFTPQPSLSAPVVTPVIPPELPAPSGSGTSSSPGPTSGSTASSRSTGPTGGSTPSTTPADPCRPSDPAVVAACLAAPWGLAPLPDGVSALVGERTTGRILRVAPGYPPVRVTTVAGLDATGGGGLLGIAVSPTYAQDGLIYAYVTTATDNRVIRIAAGDRPKPILSGIPKGTTGNGGAIGFTGDGTLYIGTGDAGSASTAANPASLAGKLLRVNQSGRPAAGNPVATSPIFSSGFTQVTGLCQLPTGVMAAVDHRSAVDVLLPARAGKSYAKLRSGDAVWTWTAGEGGAADCAVTSGLLANTSLGKQRLTGIAMSRVGTFSGSPRVLLGPKYGRLLTVTPGANGSLWLTTSNKDGHGRPVASDDRVILLPDAGSAGGNGPD